MRGDEGERTYGLWGPVVVFVLLAVVGIGLLIFGGGSDTATVQVPVRQTLPEVVDRGGDVTPGVDADGADAVDPGDAAPADSSGAGTPPLPGGATEALRDGASTSYSFSPPSGADVDALEAVVAPLRVRVGADDRSVELLVGCARSAEEFLAQVVVTEAGPSVSFAAISVVPPDSSPCVEGDEPRRVELQLVEPLAGRSVVVVPAGTEVPELLPG